MNFQVESAALELKRIREQIKILELSADAHKKTLLENVTGQFNGEHVVVSISDVERESLDRVSLEKAVGSEFIRKYIKKSSYKKVDVITK